jgi:hypothetical protein
MSASNDHRYDRRAPRDRGLRVGDQERETVSEILRERHLEGRLDNDEFQARLERCLSARTYADLDALVADLPPEVPEPAESRARSVRPWPAFLVPVALIAAIALSHGHAAWLIFPFVLFFVLRRFAWACRPRRATRA